jgi:hypothetical protein
MYATALDFRELRGITSISDDALVDTLLSRAQKAVESYCRRVFEGEAAERAFDSAADVEGRWLYVYRAGDLASITSITNGDGAAVASTEYVTEPRGAEARGVPIWAIVLKERSGVYWRTGTGGDAEDAITVNGVWAYSAEPPADVVQATLMLAGYYYDQRLSTDGSLAVIPGVSVTIPQGMPAAVRQLLEPYRRAEL